MCKHFAHSVIFYGVVIVAKNAFFRCVLQYKRSLGAPGVKDIKDIEFDWTGLADYEFYKSLARRKKIIKGIVIGCCGLIAAIFFILLK